LSLSFDPSLDALSEAVRHECDRIISRGGRSFVPPVDGGFDSCTPLARLPVPWHRSSGTNCRHFVAGGGVCDFCRFDQLDLIEDAFSLRRARRLSIRSNADSVASAGASSEPAPPTQGLVEASLAQ